MLLALDTETLGLDLFHGARPFYVTTCDENKQQYAWEWPVNPLTRKVGVVKEDLLEIQALLDEADVVVGQNIKFDVGMLRALWEDHGLELRWDWGKTRDTLRMGHVLASNQRHDLTAMALHYLRERIDPWEDALEAAVKKARGYCQRNLKVWRIAREGLAEMPSAREKTWKYDSWLPKRLAKHLKYPEPDDGKCFDGHGVKHRWSAEDHLCRVCGGHRWYKVLEEYADTDSSVTVALAQRMEHLLRQRGLWEIYDFTFSVTPIINGMERRGVTLSRPRLEELREQYVKESAELGQECVELAAGYGYELNMPKGGNNNSLRYFCFGEPVLNDEGEPTGVRRPWLKLPTVARTETGQPSLAAEAVREYLGTLEEDTDQYRFVKALSGKRSRDTAVSYLDGYKRFWLPWPHRQGDDLWVLHPNLNPTGTDTLRMSSSQPNEQNISKKEGFNLRYTFGPPPSWEWWSFDFKNIERRIPVYEANEQELITVLFERPDDPPFYGSDHLLNFSTVYPEIWAPEVGQQYKDRDHVKTKYKATEYQWCKNGGFALQYNCGRNKADATFHRQGAYDQLKSKFNKLERHNQWCIQFAEKHGYIETMPDRTVNPERGYPLLCTRTENNYILNTVPLSYRTQGTAMWLTYKAMVRVEEQLDKWRREETDPFDAYIVLQVHDELVVAMPRRGDPVVEVGLRNGKGPLFRTGRGSNLWRARMIQDLMAAGGQDLIPSVPTPVGVEYHAVSWDKGHTF